MTEPPDPRLDERLHRIEQRLDGIEHGIREAWGATQLALQQLQARIGRGVDGPPRETPPLQTLTDLGEPEHDTVPPRAPVPPERPYVVCSTPRSGSTLLCRGLAAAGVAGVPLEYFHPIWREQLSARWGAASLTEYVQALYAHRTTPAGVFGTKLHWDQLYTLRAELLGLPRAEPAYGPSADFLEDVLPGVRYVRIVRLDVDRQAVSLWSALSSGMFSARVGEEPRPGEVTYDFEGIDRCRRIVENGEVHWDRFFAVNGIEPLKVTYEHFADAYAETIERVVRWLVPEVEDVHVPAPASRKLADDRSTAMVERFISERGDLPDPLRA